VAHPADKKTGKIKSRSYCCG